MKRGKFIVLYGINNLGKTTQAKLLVKKLKKNGYKAEYIKYPIYALEPAGSLINGYLRKGNPYKFSPREFQLLHFLDKVKFEPILETKLKKGFNVVAEDYFGTTMAWGIGTGVDKKLLEQLKPFVYQENLAILFDGKRFIQSVEKGHKHENDAGLMDRVRKVHLDLAKKYKWQKIDANLSIKEIEKIVWDKVEKVVR